MLWSTVMRLYVVYLNVPKSYKHENKNIFTSNAFTYILIIEIRKKLNQGRVKTIIAYIRIRTKRNLHPKYYWYRTFVSLYSLYIGMSLTALCNCKFESQCGNWTMVLTLRCENKVWQVAISHKCRKSIIVIH